MTGTVASFAILFILILTLAGLSIAVVNAMFDSPWGTFTVFCTIPIALLMGLYMHKIRPGDVKGASIIGVVLLFLAIVAGPYVAADPTLAAMFTFSKKQIAVFIPIYGFLASVLPVWLLLCPRDYLSTYLKIGTIVMLALGIVVVHPQLAMAPLTKYCRRRRPDHSRRGLSLRLHHHRLRRALRLPRHHRHRHHAEDDRQRDAISSSSATAPCWSRASWRSWP